jgi:hypothetical protein
VSGPTRSFGLVLAGLAGLWPGPAPAQEGAGLSSSGGFRLEAVALGAAGGELRSAGSGSPETVEVTVSQAAPVGVTRGAATGTEAELGFWHVPEPSRRALGLAALVALLGLRRSRERRTRSRG